jgi:hypothetical protein
MPVTQPGYRRCPNGRATLSSVLVALSQQLGLGSLLAELQARFGGYDLLEHWQQGEFHHDLLLRLPEAAPMPGPFLVVATNCNGGVKELLCFERIPGREALWHHRCPGSAEFTGELPPVLASARTIHWFDPCQLLSDDARSEYREGARERQSGGGWQLKSEPGAAGARCRSPKPSSPT